jgi:hypothetical protein
MKYAYIKAISSIHHNAIRLYVLAYQDKFPFRFPIVLL